jgi:hypothetical protein
VAPDVPEPFDAVCRKAMEMDREARFASAAEMREALEHAVAAVGLTLPRPAAIGAILDNAFAEERAKVRAVIDEQIRLLAGASTAEYSAVATDLVPLPVPSGTGSGMVPGPIEPTGVTSLSVASSVAAAPRPRRTLVLALAAASVVVAMGIFFVVRSVLGTATPVAPTSASGMAEAGPKMVHVRLAGVPAGALVTVDGQPLQAGSTTVEGHPGERRAVRVVAPGFDALEFPIDLVDDQTMPIMMAAPRAAASTAPAPSTRPVLRPPPVVTAHPTASATAKPTSTGVDLGY